MGRGRAKAKQQKVARELKYQTGGTSIEALREELGADTAPSNHADGDAEDTYYDPYDNGDEEPDDGLADHYAHDAGERSDR